MKERKEQDRDFTAGEGEEAESAEEGEEGEEEAKEEARAWWLAP